MNQILILYSDDSDSHLALKKLKAYLREIYVKRENTKHHKKQTGVCQRSKHRLGKGSPQQGL